MLTEEAGDRPQPSGPARRKSRFVFWLALITLVAAVLREHYALVAVVGNPLLGDAREYASYAWNIVHHGVFSMVPPQSVAPPPDAYRPPGYPLLLALGMRLRPDEWYGWIIQIQILLGTATVALTAMVGKRWLPEWAALSAAGLLAFWPHHIVACDTLLSEVLFGFLLMAGLFACSRRKAAVSGLLFAAAALTNLVVALFPPILAVLARRHRGRRAWTVFLVLFALPLALLLLRNTMLPATPHDRPGRLAVNLVQGSWPLYHAAQNDARLGKPIPIAIMRQIDDESRTLAAEPVAGLARIGGRLGQDPLESIGWYLLRKPWLLWDWDIRVGHGGPYFLAPHNSPLDRQPLLHAITLAYRAANPLLAFAAAFGLLLVLATRHGRASEPAFATALLVLYLTAVHAVLQSEPRYANAYRGLECLLAMTAMAWARNTAVRRWRPGPLSDQLRAVRDHRA